VARLRAGGDDGESRENRKRDPRALLGRACFGKWLRQFDADAWDRKIEADARAGKLDELAEAALKRQQAQ